MLVAVIFSMIAGTFVSCIPPIPGASPAHKAAQPVVLEWDSETGTGCAGYKVYVGKASHTYNTNIDVGLSTTCSLPNLTTGTTYFFAVTAYSANRAESGYSNEIS